MKTSVSWQGVAWLAVLAMVFLFCCSDPMDDGVTPKEEEEQEEEEITPDEVDALLQTLSFSSGTKITGSVPSVVNTSLVKSDSEDTIYTMPGAIMLLRLSHPESTPVKGWYLAAKGSTFYFDVPIDDEEDSDSVSVVILEIDAEDDEAPYDIPVEITPYDNSNQPIDVIERIITVEKPLTNGCDILVPGDTTSNRIWNWSWQWTVVLNGSDSLTFINAPGRKFESIQHPSGCCNDEADCPALVYNEVAHKWEWEYNSQVTAVTSYSIEYELFGFYPNGTFSRVTSEDIVNFDPIATDWCGPVTAAAYSVSKPIVLYYGTHNYVPGNSNILYNSLRKDCDDPWGLCGYGSRPGSIKFSCHTLMITVDRLMLENTKETRMYGNRYRAGFEQFLWND